jgi:hypothetical protein
VHFVSYFTVSPTKDELHKYIESFEKEVNSIGNSKLWILGHQVQHMGSEELPESIKTFNSIERLVGQL